MEIEKKVINKFISDQDKYWPTEYRNTYILNKKMALSW